MVYLVLFDLWIKTSMDLSIYLDFSFDEKENKLLSKSTIRFINSVAWFENKTDSGLEIDVQTDIFEYIVWHLEQRCFLDSQTVCTLYKR